MKILINQVLLFFSYMLFYIAIIPVMSDAHAYDLNRRGIAMGGSAASDGKSYYYDVNVKINDDEAVYFTAIPAYTKDADYLFQYFPRYGKTYSFQATAYDSHGYQGAASVVSDNLISNFTTSDCSAVTVPIADPGPDQLAQVGNEVSLDAGDSYDFFYNDKASILYYWECYAWPGDGEITLSDQNAVNPVFTPAKEGTYYFRLYIADTAADVSFNRSPVRYVAVNAVNDIADYVIANPGSPKSIPLGGNVILDGSLSSATSETVYYKWEALNKTVDIQNSDQPVASFTPQTTGTYAFQLTVTAEHDFSSKITFVSVYDEAEVGSLYYQDIDHGCTDCSISDQDDDGDIDGIDLAALALSFNSQKGLDTYKKEYDFDRNLRIDKNDLMMTTGCYGKIVIQN
ncbi:hypothetical protein BuS5_01392 [Desulfosarcina sp. BuS5]|uniref:PKD domain-containing protein n=1 Tax=Desulfosarcina sp. BuS5 TaxID=933262 RepID=UPI0004881672|nr:hypothetical protein [Desulfosarcina sp. BuS5]WDN88424.1 hypothetical protein BuS5_01392 [Desulfosarcina sp. BuS5]